MDLHFDTKSEKIPIKLKNRKIGKLIFDIVDL